MGHGIELPLSYGGQGFGTGHTSISAHARHRLQTSAEEDS